jgi:sirohydrochlorin ferrochelatase
MNALLVISHGSHSPKTKDELEHLVRQLKKQLPGRIVECAFLEITSPNIPEGIESCIHKGATSILVLLNFLNSGKHVDEDIPAIIEHARKKHPHVRISLSRPIGKHRGIVDLFIEAVQSAEQ